MLSLNRPYVLIKTAVSLDGCIDDTTNQRLIISNEADKIAVDSLKTTFDAVLVGAQTIRKDNPSLLIKRTENCQKRISQGLKEQPIKVTLTSSGNLELNSKFFQDGVNEKIIYCPAHIEKVLTERFGLSTTIVSLPGSMVNPSDLLNDLYRRGVNRLMIEGGEKINSLFLKHKLVDEIRIAIAPFFVGEINAPRLVSSLHLPYDKNNHLKLKSTEILDDIVVLNYQL